MINYGEPFQEKQLENILRLLIWWLGEGQTLQVSMQHPGDLSEFTDSVTEIWPEFPPIPSIKAEQTTNVCSKKGSKWILKFESRAETCIGWTSFNFRFKEFLSNLKLLLKIITYCATDEQSITASRSSVLNFKFIVLTFPMLISCLISIGQNLCERKNLNSNQCPCYDVYWSKICCQQFWYTFSGFDIQLEQSEMNPLHIKICFKNESYYTS